MQKLTTFLMFPGNAEAAMELYMSVFPGAHFKSIARYGAEGPGAEGTIRHAICHIAGQDFMCIDSPGHQFTFTPAISIYVDCESVAEVDKIYAALSDGGKIMMPLGKYPFSQHYAWLSDRFGVSWQLSYNPAM